MVDYLFFLARTATVVVAVLLVIGGGTAIAVRAGRRAGHRPRLEITDLGRRYDELRRTLENGLLPRRAARRAGRADRRRAAALAATRAKALAATRAKAPADTRTDGLADRPRDRAGTPAEQGPHQAEGSGPVDGRPRVYVLDFVGDLRASGVAALREEVTAVLTVAAPGDEVVVRLENPGGVVHDQGLAASQLERLRRRGIRLTVAVDTVAASGGYLMACVADRIVAAPFALVGSIGVIAQVPTVHRLLDRYGVGVEQFKAGEYKRTVTPFEQPTEADRAKLTEQLDDIHTLFKDFVAAHRPGLDLAAVATGEAWYGTRALELRLVDELCTSDDYLLAAHDRADLLLVRYHPSIAAGRRVLPRLAAGLLARAR